MKISHLQENLTPASAPSASVPGPKFGRSDEMLESGVGATTAGAVATGSTANMGVQRRSKKGSDLLKGIKTSEKYANSRKAGISEDAINEDDLSEEQLQAKQRREDLFNRAKDRDIGNKPKSREIMAREEFNGGGEYNDEIDMVQNNLHTIVRVSTHLGKELQSNENMPEWVQEKIAIAKSMIVTVMDYMLSQHERGNVYTQDMDESQQANYSNYATPDLLRMIKTIKRDENGLKIITAITSEILRRKQGVVESKPDFGKMFDKKIGKHNAAVVKTKKEIGTRVADIGPGGKEYNVKTDKEWDNQKGVAEGSQEDAKFTPRFEVRSRIEGALDQYLDPEQVAGGYTDIQYYKHDGRVYVEVLFNYTNGQKIGPTQRKRFLVNKDFTLTPIKRQQGVAEGAKVDRMVKHVKSSEKKLGHDDKEAENIAWATANKRGMLDNKNKKVEEDKDPCWDNYKQIGMKKKNGKTVPNCVPKK